MANVFKSKEIYKHVNVTGTNSGDKLFSVRGMYVSGQHRSPYYIDSGIHIKSINTTKAKIKNFTTSYEDLQADHVLNLIRVEVSEQPTITPYTRAYEDLQADHVLNLIRMDVSDKADVIYYNNIKQNTLPEHMVCIKSITTTKAVVSNI